MAFHFFDAILYINLEHRKDREGILLNHLEEYEVPADKIVRIDAVHDLLNGHKGCVQSHIKALDFAIENNLKNVLILEDDMCFSYPKEIIQNEISYFFTNFSQPWHVFFIGANVFEAECTKDVSIKRVLCAQAAHAYSVHLSYFKKLKKCFEAAYIAMKNDETFDDSLFKALDQSWKKLQVKDLWFIGKVLAQQRRSYSDIFHQIRERKHQDYFS